MSKMPNDRETNQKLRTAQERHRAAGNEKPFPERMKMLTELMLRNDLSHAEHRVIYLLFAYRANERTGLCFTTDARMAEDLGLHVRSIERAKASLKAKGLLRWTTHRDAGKNDVSVYHLNTGNSVAKDVEEYRHFRRNSDNNVAQIPAPAPDVLSIEHLEGKFYAAADTPELEKWDRWSRATRGKPFPKDKNGGWLVPSREPPIRKLTIAELFDL
jgi:hypothetical protein